MKASERLEDDLPTLPIPYRPSRRPNVLVAEDDDELRSLIVAGLRASGFEVEAVADGHDVLDKLTAACEGNAPVPDALIMDVRMPQCSGTDVLRAFRGAGWRQPVILVTAFPDDELREVVAKHAATMVLGKPVDLDELAQVAKMVLEVSSRAADPEPRSERAWA